MAITPTNTDKFAGSEFGEWAHKSHLEPAESYFFDRYLRDLDPEGTRILDVGTGSGRFLFNLATRKFRALTGIDICDELLEVARKRAAETGAPIEFTRMDVSAMKFPDGCFEVVLAMQQVLSFISARDQRERALKEIQRVLKPGGLLLLSVLPFEGRRINLLASISTLPIKIFRGESRYASKNYLPWLRTAGKPNFRYLFSRQPYIYWFSTKKIIGQLERLGFDIIEAKSSRMIRNGETVFRHGGSLYIAAKLKANQEPGLSS